jgi:hypothetical protein
MLFTKRPERRSDRRLPATSRSTRLFRPTSFHAVSDPTTLILRTIAGAPDDALAAWRALTVSWRLEDFDAVTTPLLPLVHRRLLALGAEDAWTPRLAGVRRKAWAANTLLLRAAADMLEALGAGGVRSVMLGGAALIATHYRDASLRPVREFEILIDPGSLRDAATILMSLGWRPFPGLQVEPHRIVVRQRHALIHPAGQRLVVNWHVLDECCYPRADDDFWRRSAPVRFEDLDGRALDPTDQLLDVCMRAARSEVPDAIWMADAATILSAGPPVDQQRLLDEVRTRCVVEPFRRALTVLRDLVRLDAAAPILDRLEALPLSALERIEGVARRLPRLLQAMSRPGLRYRRYLVCSRPTGEAGPPSQFFTFLRDHWALDSALMLPAFVARRGITKLRRRHEPM